MAWRRFNFHRDHRWAGPRLSAFVDEELNATHQRRLYEHQSICPECRRAIQGLRKLVANLSRLRGTPEDAMVERAIRSVMGRIDDEGSHPG